MRKFFNYLSATTCFVLIAFCAVYVKADTPRYVISAKAGGVNIVTGQVTLTSKKDKSQSALTTKDKLEAGDIITTGSDGRVEITLNPGSYLRLGENSSLELTTTNLDDLRLQLFKGNAVVEAAGGDDLAIVITVNTPQTKVSLVRKGIYRLNVADSATEVQVWKGQAEVGNGVATKVKGSNKLIVGSTNAGTSKLDKKAQDSLDSWSKERAKFLADERSKLEKKTVVQSMSSFYNGFGSFFSSFPFYGAWLYSFRGCYLFVPFDAWAWSSPYGFNYFDASFGGSFFGGLPWGSYYCPYRCGGGGGFYNNPIYTGSGGNGNGNGGTVMAPGRDNIKNGSAEPIKNIPSSQPVRMDTPQTVKPDEGSTRPIKP